MPKAYTYTAEFNPISFSDRIAPLKLYKEEYDKQQAAYEKLLEETDDLGVLKNIAMDRTSYNIYDKYKSEINDVATAMARDGITPDVKNRLLELKKSRKTEIDPLIEKQKIRSDLVKEQRKYRETHPNSIFDIDYDEVPLENITKESTFTPYDLTSRIKDTSELIYSNMLTNQGEDTTDYDKIKSQYNYSNLSPKKKAIIDDVINVSRDKASSAYKTYMDTINLKMYQYSNTGRRYRGSGTGTGTGTSKTKDPKNFYLPDTEGVQINIKTDDLGQKYVVGPDGETRIYNTPTEDDINNEKKIILAKKDISSLTKDQLDKIDQQATASAISKAVDRAKYGGNVVYSYSKNNTKTTIVNSNGKNIMFVTDDKGKTTRRDPSFENIERIYVEDKSQDSGYKQQNNDAIKGYTTNSTITISTYKDLEKQPDDIVRRIDSLMRSGKTPQEAIASGKKIIVEKLSKGDKKAVRIKIQ